MIELKPGMLFTKDGDVYLVADSKNQRWIVDIVKGEAKWFFKANMGTIADAEKQGYTFMSTTKETLNQEQNIYPVSSVSLEESPKEYKPMSEFDMLLKQKLGV